MTPMRPTTLCPICPDCGQKALQLNCVMGYWECFGYWPDEPMRYWVFNDKGALVEVRGDTYVDDDGSLKHVV